MAEPLYAFNRRDKDALVRLIDTSGSTGIQQQNIYDATALLLAVATTGVPARSGTTLGKATDLAVKYLGESSGNKVILDAGYTVTAHNLSATAVGTGSYVLLSRLGDAWIVTWEDC